MLKNKTHCMEKSKNIMNNLQNEPTILCEKMKGTGITKKNKNCCKKRLEMHCVKDHKIVVQTKTK